LHAQSIEDRRRGEIILELSDPSFLPSIQALMASFEPDPLSKRVQNRRVTPITNAFPIYLLRLDVTLTDENKVYEALKKHAGMVAIQWNYNVYPRNTLPNDPQYDEQWHLNLIHAPSLWDELKGGVTACGDTIVVAVSDFGFDAHHPDLQENIWHNRQEIPNNGVDDDGNGYMDDFDGWNAGDQSDKHSIDTVNVNERLRPHGTPCAGIIGAVGNNGKLLSGINWHIKLMLLSNAKTIDRLIANYAYALKMRQLWRESNGSKGAFVAVTSMSIGLKANTRPEQQPVWCNMYEKLGAEGILNVVATRDADENVDVTGDVPSQCGAASLICVTATSKQDDKLKFAATGQVSVDLGAPGESIPVLYPNNDSNFDSGTSYSAPLVAGAAALMYNASFDGLCKSLKTNPMEAASVVKNVLLKGVKKVSSLQNTTVSGGRLDVWQSYQLLKKRYTALRTGDFFNIYPNPTMDKLFVEVNLTNVGGKGRVVVVNATGQQIAETTMDQTTGIFERIEWDTNLWAAGIYCIKVMSENNDFQRVMKIVVVK
jgi:subtilisin family serine protease